MQSIDGLNNWISIDNWKPDAWFIVWHEIFSCTTGIIDMVTSYKTSVKELRFAIWYQYAHSASWVHYLNLWNREHRMTKLQIRTQKQLLLWCLIDYELRLQSIHLFDLPNNNQGYKSTTS